MWKDQDEKFVDEIEDARDDDDEIGSQLILGDLAIQKPSFSLLERYNPSRS